MRKILLFAIIIATYVEISDKWGHGPQKPEYYPSSPDSSISRNDTYTRFDSFRHTSHKDCPAPYPEDIHDPNSLDFDPTSDTFNPDEVEKYKD